VWVAEFLVSVAGAQVTSTPSKPQFIGKPRSRSGLQV